MAPSPLQCFIAKPSSEADRHDRVLAMRAVQVSRGEAEAERTCADERHFGVGTRRARDEGPMHSSRAPMETLATMWSSRGTVERRDGVISWVSCNSNRLASTVIGRNATEVGRCHSTGTGSQLPRNIARVSNTPKKHLYRQELPVPTGQNAKGKGDQRLELWILNGKLRPDINEVRI